LASCAPLLTRLAANVQSAARCLQSLLCSTGATAQRSAPAPPGDSFDARVARALAAMQASERALAFVGHVCAALGAEQRPLPAVGGAYGMNAAALQDALARDAQPDLPAVLFGLDVCPSDMREHDGRGDTGRPRRRRARHGQRAARLHTHAVRNAVRVSTAYTRG
jgi:hypothetical protein